VLKKILVASVIAACCASLIGCGGIAKKKPDNSGEKKPATTTQTTTKPVAAVPARLDADIYIDGTYSMSGYVKGNTNTAYMNAVKALESTIKSNWKDESVSFIKFGDSNKALTREQFLAFEKVDFYQEKDTSLQKVVNSLDDKKLSVIVTDLFQTNQDIESVGYALKEKCFTKEGKAVGIIGVKSQFDGVIYDIGRNLSSQEYKSTGDASSYRPFYMVLIGNEKDVKALAAAYEKNVPGSRKVIISKNFAGEGKIDTVKGGKNPEKLPLMSKLGTVEETLNLKLKKSEKQSLTNISYNTKNIISELPKSYSLVLEKLEVLAAEKAPGQKEGGALDKVTGMLTGDKKNAKMVLEPVSFKPNFLSGDIDYAYVGGEANMKIALKLAPAGIDKKEGQYKLTMAMLPTKEEYFQCMTKSFADWNFSDDSTPSPQEVGTKTQNINKFVSWLCDVNYNFNKPGFHNAVLYVKTE